MWVSWRSNGRSDRGLMEVKWGLMRVEWSHGGLMEVLLVSNGGLMGPLEV